MVMLTHAGVLVSRVSDSFQPTDSMYASLAIARNVEEHALVTNETATDLVIAVPSVLAKVKRPKNEFFLHVEGRFRHTEVMVRPAVVH